MVIEKYDLEPGRSLGSHYEIIAQMGSGWEGEVYKIRENRTGIIRAAKLFYPRTRDRERPLLQYARKLYKLRSCPIVIQYHHRDTARVRGRKIDFLVSDFVDGEMLSSYLARSRGKRLTSFEALHLLYALALGIEPVHFLGEYHGDIHSDNVMVKRRGIGFDVYLLDFFDLGRATKAKIQQDVYDLIGILYEMIGGRDGYARAGDEIRQIVMGRRHSLISRKFNMAGHLRLELENLEWGK
ncbi:MAG: serine/threonine protein kinase [candidate division Zixibacteria bacterium]|nr:serine/threonine protein kinase [candidate division Zixibacteria bacterium]